MVPATSVGTMVIKDELFHHGRQDIDDCHEIRKNIRFERFGDVVTMTTHQSALEDDRR